ncbi:PAC2 family protein [Halorubrum ezzemoulense]|nr:PAC2 family protein [Halorubrum ezzemoulense]MDB9284216.1 PAC2 family protein [Halorubrum ezzemoulense]
MGQPPADPTRFGVEHDTKPGDALLAGFPSFGLAGLTAVHYLVDDLDLEETGRVRIDGAPSITPFTKGDAAPPAPAVHRLGPRRHRPRRRADRGAGAGGDHDRTDMWTPSVPTVRTGL